jgi:hypothetical protein
MTDGETAEVVKPDIIVAYYKGLRQDTRRLPGGLAMIAGYDSSTGENTTVTWQCNNIGTDGIDPNCSGDLQLTVRFPAC